MSKLTLPLAVLVAVAVLAAVTGFWTFALLALALALVTGLVMFGHWAFSPRHELPRHRVRHLRLRLYLRLHPGRGHATVFELWRHWSSRASAQKDRYARP